MLSHHTLHLHHTLNLLSTEVAMNTELPLLTLLQQPQLMELHLLTQLKEDIRLTYCPSKITNINDANNIIS
jgi:hypothetical protein